MQKFIPPLFVLLCLLSMLAIHLLLRSNQLILYPLNLVGIVFIVTGLIMVIWVGRYFKKVATQIHTFKTPVKLVTQGLFKYTRNPIYLGFTILLLGFAALFGTWVSFIFPLLFLIVANFWYIPIEEKNMTKIFGNAYRSYRSKVKRWI